MCETQRIPVRPAPARRLGACGAKAALALAAAVLLVLAYPRRQAPGDHRETLTLWVLPGMEDTFRVAVEEFQRRHPGYRVVIGNAAVRDAVGDPTRYLLSVVGGTPPDLIYYDRFAVVEWASRGAFLDLAPYLDADRDRPDGVRREHYYAPAWDETVYRGGTYAIPNSMDTRPLFYNRDLLLRAGFSRLDERGRRVPRPPRTWEEILGKRLEAPATATRDGKVTLADAGRWPSAARPGDVAVLLKGDRLFRARVLSLDGSGALRLDFSREQLPGRREVPEALAGNVTLKLFDQDAYAIRLTRYHAHTGTMSEVGILPLYGNSWLYQFCWANGGELMAGGDTRSTFDAAENVGALSFLVDLHDAMGGVEAVNAFQASATSGGLDPFCAGKVAMRIDCSEAAAVFERDAPNLEYGTAEPPMPARRLAAGAAPVSWLGGWAYAIPAGVRRPDASWALLRWLCSEEANALTTNSAASLHRARGQTYYPRLHPDKRVMATLMRECVEENPLATERIKEAYRVGVDLVPRSRYRPVVPVGQKMWLEQIRATERALRHAMPAAAALAIAREQTQTALDRFLHPPTGPVVSWGWFFAVYAAAALGGLAWLVRRGAGGGDTRRGSWWIGFAFVSPWLLGFLVFGAGPMFFSLVIAFCRYDVLNPAQFIGLENFGNLAGDPLFWKSLANTLFMALGVPLGIVAGMALAMLLNRRVRGMGVWRALFYLPAIMPTMATLMLWLWVFNPSTGLLNEALRWLGVADPPNWLDSPLWSKPSLLLMGLWGVGGGMVVWLAGLLNIPENLYEAAALDGAGKWRQFRHVTLPLMTPYIFFNLVMGLIGTFQIFEQAYILTDGGPADSTMFYAYKLFNEAFRFLDMGAASAMAWVLFALILAVTGLNFLATRYWVHYDS